MLEVLLAGTFPAGTLEKMQQAVTGTDIHIRAVVTEEEFARENDVDAIILRILKMPRPVIQRFSSRLKMIMRWGMTPWISRPPGNRALMCAIPRGPMPTPSVKWPSC